MSRFLNPFHSYVFAARVRRQKRWMLARMSLAVLVQRKVFGSAWWCEIGNQAEHPSLEGAFSQ